MTTPAERFDLAEKASVTIGDIAKDFKEIGIYGDNEYKFFAELLYSLATAMKILDPEKYEVYMQKQHALFLAAQGQPPNPGLGPTQTGQYL